MTWCRPDPSPAQWPMPQRCVTCWTRICSPPATSTSARHPSISSVAQTPVSAGRRASALRSPTMLATAADFPSSLTSDRRYPTVVSFRLTDTFCIQVKEAEFISRGKLSCLLCAEFQNINIWGEVRCHRRTMFSHNQTSTKYSFTNSNFSSYLKFILHISVFLQECYCICKKSCVNW